MDIREKRRAELERLVNAEETIAAFAKKNNIDATYLSQLLNRHRNIGERSARKLEENIGLPIGYLDGATGKIAELTPEQIEWLHMRERLGVEDRKALFSLGRSLAKQTSKKAGDSGGGQ